MKEISQTIKCYLFTRRDLILLLSLYNSVFLTFSVWVKERPILSFLIAFFVTLIVLLVIAVVDIFELKEKIKAKLLGKEIVANVREEYKKIYTLKRKKEILDRACANPGEIKKQNHMQRIEKNKLGSVHFAYISNFAKNKKGSPSRREGTSDK